MGPSFVLDGRGEEKTSYVYRGSNPESFIPQRVAIPKTGVFLPCRIHTEAYNFGCGITTLTGCGKYHLYSNFLSVLFCVSSFFILVKNLICYT